MDLAECQGAMRTRIAQTEQENEYRRDRETKFQPQAVQQDQSSGDDQLPVLPPHLPRPEYAKTVHLIGQDDKEVSFYAACELGLMPQVESFIQESNPSQAVRQFGLEQASFGNQPAVARYLLEHGTLLHDNVFLRRELGQPGDSPKDISIFDRERQESQDPLALVQVFLDFGWHPNQLWHGTQVPHNFPKAPFMECLTNRPLLTLLLSHGADTALSRHNVSLYDKIPLDRRCGSVIDSAVGLWDPSLVALLVDHGAEPTYARPLHKVVRWMGGPSRGPPFSQRRPMAEYLLSSGTAKVDDVKRITFSDIIHRPSPRKEDLTPFVYACAGQDWDMAEWLLEKGADADALGGKAFQPMYFMMPYYGPSDPKVVKALVEKIKNRET
ncbi:hypothetical protein EDB81DRAFT_799280 [Dactylonectria macrodidyma]|uniref:Uncharacterized protein n=1 Tax=Dactylonectria macrodidyma TaxID=307937 RepID=A0A9P9EPT8_9HYPO|nr:hypothetical protein EDB81DRAFT_799280 [Dactylonectria macrodidyma]